MEEKIDSGENQNINQPKRDYLLPASILIAAVLVSGSLIYNTGKKPVGSGEANLAGSAGNVVVPAIDNIKPVTKEDHVFGNFGAPIKIVVFSDLECQFCKNFHYTMKKIVAAYGGKVAWVYRHFPLDSLHSKARKEAEATECANELGGNQGFWDYMDRLMEVTPSNNGLDLALLPKIAEDVGLDRVKFQSCLDSGKYAGHVADNLADAENSGGEGTPYSILIAKDGKKYVIPGALPEERVKTIIDQAL